MGSFLILTPGYIQLNIFVKLMTEYSLWFKVRPTSSRSLQNAFNVLGDIVVVTLVTSKICWK